MRRLPCAVVTVALSLGCSGLARAQSADAPPPPPPQYSAPQNAPPPPPPDIPPPPPEQFPSAPPPQAGPPGPYSPQRWVAPPPAQIDDWSPGDPVPSGYHPVTRRHKGLIISGAITLGVSYSLALLLAAANDTTSPGGSQNGMTALLVPLAGPFIQLGLRHDSSDDSFLFLDGLAQVTGATLLVLGMVVPSHFLLRNDLAGDGSGIAVGPMLARRGGGLSLSGHF